MSRLDSSVRARQFASCACLYLLLFGTVTCAPSAAVVGAGEHGLIAAVELQNRGFDVSIFEQNGTAVPILNTVQLDHIYDYLSVGVYPSETFNGSGTVPSLAAFAAKYHQQLELLPGSRGPRCVYFDSTQGTTSVPPFARPLLGDHCSILHTAYEYMGILRHHNHPP